MKKLSIIAALVFTTVFFASCENKEVIPQVNNYNVATQTVDFQDPEFVSKKDRLLMLQKVQLFQLPQLLHMVLKTN